MGYISRREHEVIHMIANEHTTIEIAEAMYLSVHTIHSHRKNIMEKLKVRNVAGMIRKSFEMGLLQISGNPSIQNK